VLFERTDARLERASLMYIGGVTGAVIGLLVRYALKGRMPDDTIFTIQGVIFGVGCAVGLAFDVREMWRKKGR
jgi:hypothetical protein